MIRADYIVITAVRDAHVDALYPAIVGQYVSAPKQDRIMQYYGYRGKNNVFVGQSDDRIMIWASGKEADYVARTLRIEDLRQLSVARLDLQITMTCLDADYLIEHIQPSKIYKCTKISSIHEKGTTLYVGSPSSNIRLRVYNKTAEAQIYPDGGGEYVRYELQCRNQYADKAFVALRNNMVRAFYLMILKRMVDTFTFNTVKSAIEASDEELFVDDFPNNKDDPVERKKRWLEQSVFPAMRRMLLEDKDYLDSFIEKLYNSASAEGGTDMY